MAKTIEELAGAVELAAVQMERARTAFIVAKKKADDLEGALRESNATYKSKRRELNEALGLKEEPVELLTRKS